MYNRSGGAPTIIKINVLKCIRVDVTDVKTSRKMKLLPIAFNFCGYSRVSGGSTFITEQISPLLSLLPTK
jgi:hypothetical protein